MMIAKWGKERISLEGLSDEINIGQVKDLLRQQSGVLQKRQKLIGLALKAGGKVTDETLVKELKVKASKKKSDNGVIVHEFIMMGTKEEEIFVDPGDKDDLPDVVDDFDLDFNAGSSEVSFSCAAFYLFFPRSSFLLSFRSVAPTCCQW